MNVHEISKYLSDIGRKGGEQTLNLHGVAYFKALSKKAHEAKKQLNKMKKQIRRENEKIIKPIIN